MRRRDLMLATLAVPVIARAAPAPAAAPTEPQPFDPGMVRSMARDMASRPYQAPDRRLPDALSNLTYDQYRMIRFRPDRAIWRGTGLPFQLEMFHRGFLYVDRVDILEVADGKARPILYDPELFDLGKLQIPPNPDLGFAGFRIHAPINRPDYFDEFCVFLGASYFRAVGKGMNYGLSARGLSIKTADPSGEEFPLFKTFWIEKPPRDAGAIVVHALLDSPSATGAYRFTIRPGASTVFDVEMAVFPRTDLADPGIAPMTSMFLFDANNRSAFDDYRRAVHDSDGLLMLTGRGERLWRPLNNPANLQVSAFGDTGPRGFGLLQRKRDFSSYEDLEAAYQTRPSLWVEPIGDSGEGAIMLVEIPSRKEIHDNIVSFWRPKAPLKAKGDYGFTYRLYWCATPPLPDTVARVVDTREGLGSDDKSRLFRLDIAGERLKGLATDAMPRLDVSADKGAIQNAVVQPNPFVGGVAASFDLVPDGKAAELRARLMSGDDPVSETWLYRWTS